MRIPQNIGFNMLSFIFELDKSTMRNTVAPLKDKIRFLRKNIPGSNIRNTTRLVRKEPINPAT